MKKALAAALVYAFLSSPAVAEESLACWSRHSLEKLAEAYKWGGRPAAAIVYLTVKADCWEPKKFEKAARGVVVARDFDIRDEATGKVATVEMKRYPADPYRGRTFYLAYGK